MDGWSSLFSKRRGFAVFCLAVFSGLAACGGTERTPVRSTALPSSAILDATPRFAEGPVGTACLIHNRGTADAQKCGCIQAAANLTLSQAEQQRATRFFAEPEVLQRIKLSDTAEAERFWASWVAFAETAERLCKNA